MAPFVEAPTDASSRALTLLYQPHYLDILPLYIVLLTWFPLLLWLLRRHVGWALVVSVGVWMTAAFAGWKFPSYYTEHGGWMFNPLAWQLLFGLGAVVASVTQRGSNVLAGPVLVAATYLLFAFLIAAPWTSIPGKRAFRGTLVTGRFHLTDEQAELVSLAAGAHRSARVCGGNLHSSSSPMARQFVGGADHTMR